MILTEGNVSSQELNHHGLIAAVVEDLGLVELINKHIKDEDKRRIVSPGHAVKAMIINGLGFLNKRLYMVTRFFKDKPTEKLIAEGIKAEHLNDDILGKTLDQIYEFGQTKLFAKIAYEIATNHHCLNRYRRMDTTSLKVEGEYEGKQKDVAELKFCLETKERLQIVHGFSKDGRPDLKQFMLSLVMSGEGDLPIWMESQNGNSSDKVSFHETIANVREFEKNLNLEPCIWVADSALYTKKRLLKQENDFNWISRVLESLKEAKALIIKEIKEEEWQDYQEDSSYQFYPCEMEIERITQRWILVRSKHAHQREEKSFKKNIEKELEAFKKDLKAVSRKVFDCQNDANHHIEAMIKKQKKFDVSFKIEEVKRFAKKGRPSKQEVPFSIGYRLITEAKIKEEFYEQALVAKGRFILATNEMNALSLSPSQILREYKNQQSPERGFRFLKDPYFIAGEVYLKKPERIEALLFVMVLCLLVYNFAQHRLRKNLLDKNDALPNQIGKQTNQPTFKWVMEMMAGVGVVYIRLQNACQIIVTNLDDIKRKIISYFGQYAQKIYEAG